MVTGDNCEQTCSNSMDCPDDCNPVTDAELIVCDSAGCTTELCCDCGEHTTLNRDRVKDRVNTRVNPLPEIDTIYLAYMWAIHVYRWANGIDR